jgi:two-component system sensor histidine kinase BaeS
VADVAEALRQLDSALATSEERQRRFLLSVSHELRTPLTSIRGYAESLVDGAYSPDELPEVGETLVREALRLERYVADLLALARLDADDFTLAVAEVDVGRLLADGATAWADRMSRAGLTLDVEAPAQPLTVHSDAGRLRQVLDVLTDNAARVCPPGSRVVWSAAPAPGGVRLEVRDSGPGLAETDAEVAFTPGVLHDRYAGSRPVGHGLGLAIAHGLVTRLGGSIRLTRAPEGGAGFEIDLPR